MYHGLHSALMATRHSRQLVTNSGARLQERHTRRQLAELAHAHTHTGTSLTCERANLACACSGQAMTGMGHPWRVAEVKCSGPDDEGAMPAQLLSMSTLSSVHAPNQAVAFTDGPTERTPRSPATGVCCHSISVAAPPMSVPLLSVTHSRQAHPGVGPQVVKRSRELPRSSTAALALPP